MSRHDLRELRRRTGHPDQLYGTRMVRVVDGPGDGLRAIEVWNAAGLRLDVLVDRGFDVHRVEYRGRSLHWTGPPGMRSRFAYEPEGWGWLRSFHGGLLVTCGLEHVRLPIERPTPEYYFPAREHQHFGLHGRVANEGGAVLARELLDDGDEPRLRLKGEVVQASLYGENLWLWREIEVPLFAPELRVNDVVSNRGFSPTHHELLYHINLGYPLVDAGTTVELHGRGRPETMVVSEPRPGFVEQVTSHELAAGEDGLAVAVVRNPQLDLALELAYGAASLPHFYLWYMMGEGPFVIGLEPSSVGPQPDRDPATMSTLAPGASVRYQARFRVLDGQGARG
ncbi:MAG TPA: DUF4432 family protein [Actinomycetes bacterium]|jgi:hypothetical protein|nr:DUF4432 family protein [Actinomycetes bacterium]